MIRCLLVLGWLFLALGSQAQNTFIRYIDEINHDRKIRIKGCADGGLVVYSPDSSELYKLNSCGNMQWSRKFNLTPGFYLGVDFFITTRKNGFAFFASETVDGIRCARIVHLDDAGQVLWSRRIQVAQFEQTTYSIDQDDAGNFMVYANISRIGGGEVHNMITKLSENGALLWNRFYNHGGIWGGAMFTKDKGIMARTGNTLIKTDSMGQVQWASRLPAAGNLYYRPVEVSDGYVVAAQNTSGRIYFFKVTLDGLAGMSNAPSMLSGGDMPFLHPATNGRLALFINKNMGEVRRPVLMELDANLQVHHSRVLYPYSPFMEITGVNMDIGKNGIPVLAGTLSIGDVAFVPQIFFARFDRQMQSGCDGAIEINLDSTGIWFMAPVAASSTLQPVVLETVQTTATPAAHPIHRLCDGLPPLKVTIGGDSVLCLGDSVLLATAGSDVFDRYVWSNGATSASILISSPGKYWVTCTNLCRGISVSDTLEVVGQKIPEIHFPTDTNLCHTDSIRFNAYVDGATYRWHNGSTEAWFVTGQPGNVEVVIATNACQVTKKASILNCEKLEIPSLFTPNGDGINDRFVAGVAKGISAFDLEVFNRWGQQVCATTNFTTTGWDGGKQESGVYFWKLTYTNFNGQARKASGTVSLEKGE